CVTPPPPALSRLSTGNREQRRRAPVSDHPAASFDRRGTSLPSEGVPLCLLGVGAAFYVGIDWAAANHAVCVLDESGRRVAAFSIEHSAAGFTDLVRRLGRLTDLDRIAVGIERP